MSLAPASRARLAAGGAALLAIGLGFAVAQGEFLWPAAMAAVVSLIMLARWQPFPVGTVLLGVAIFGYVVGNRGFAQLMLSTRFPLLPAEAVLLVTGGLLLAQSAMRREFPFRPDPLNLLLLAWLAYGTARVAFDVRLYGFMALRDFAVVYYVAFFFLAQDAARQPGAARALLHVMLASSVVVLGVSLAFERHPQFFLGTLTFRGTPLIYYKGDLVSTFAAAGSVLAFLRFEERKRGWYVALSLLLATAPLFSGNRASMVGLLVVAAWLAIGRRWRFAGALAGGGALIALTMLTYASVSKTPWEKTPLFGVYERVVSIADPTGQRVYRGEATFNKGDNNLFRTVWWRSVIDETLEANRYTGLGFGHDIAERFARVYYPEGSEEFSARSPHNVLLTIFARMGAVGLLLFLAALSVVAVRTWRAIRAGPESAAPWCAAWVILISACFGVVLEGPMGAVVFWTLLGVAHASSTAGDPQPTPDALEVEMRPALSPTSQS